MMHEEYEVWICLWNNMCTQGNDSFCYAYNEKSEVFEPWGLNSELEMTGLDRTQANLRNSRMLQKVPATVRSR